MRNRVSLKIPNMILFEDFEWVIFSVRTYTAHIIYFDCYGIGILQYTFGANFVKSAECLYYIIRVILPAVTNTGIPADISACECVMDWHGCSEKTRRGALDHMCQKCTKRFCT